MRKFASLLLLSCFLLLGCSGMDDPDPEIGPRGFWPDYVIHGTTFNYEDRDIVEPKWRVREKYDEQVDLFRPYFEMDLDLKDDPAEVLAYYEVQFYVRENKPELCPRDYYLPKDYCERNDCSCKEVVGKTHPRDRTEIYYREFLDYGGGMYELRLHFMDLLFPGQDESEDIEWMKENIDGSQ